MEPTAQPIDWEANDIRTIRFRQPFSEKYTLTVTTDIQAASFPIATKAQIRWALRVIDVDRTGQADIELITIENQLLETNNPNFKDIAALNQAFARMYSEIHVKINPQGKVSEIVNLPVILGKWEQTKAEMEKIVKEVPAIQSIMSLNDEIFADPEKVKIGIENNEFFKIYFYLIYGVPLPAERLVSRHRNLLNSADVDWMFDIQTAAVPDVASLVDITVSGKMAEVPSAAWTREAYKAFEGAVDLSQLNPQLSEQATYRFQKETGRLLEATLTKEEIANPQYVRGKMIYELKGDGAAEIASSDGQDKESADSPIEKPPRRYYWETH